jgi:hypothetical protein
MGSFGNPIEGYLHPLGWVRPAGNLEMQVTRDCAGHQATGQGCALDINNGRCDGQVLAVAAGKVRDRDDVQGIIRIVHADGSVSGYAHMSPILVVVGQQVAQGQQIGEIGDAHDPAITNFSGCHLHFGFQLAANGPEVDPWPLLSQNQENALTFVMLEKFDPPRIWEFAPATIVGYRFDLTTLAVLSTLNPPPWTAGSSAHADQRLQVPGNVAYLHVTDGVYAGTWVPEDGTAVKLQPAPATGGHTDAELIKAVQQAGYNAANDVGAAGITALQQAAAKYPKP